MRKFLSHKIRSSWKGINDFFHISSNLRTSVITKDAINLKYFIYNGKMVKSIIPNSRMLGYKFGQFVFTKTMGRKIHIIKRKKKKKK